MTDDELADIKQRAASATPGPWYGEVGEVFVDFDRHETEKFNWIPTINGDDPRYRSAQQERDAEFIAHAREDIPALLAELDRQRTENAAMREFVQTVADSHQHQWDAVDPQEVGACEVCHVASQDYAVDIQEQARELVKGWEASDEQR